MTSTVRRAGAIAALTALSLSIPIRGPVLGAGIAVVLLLVGFGVRRGPLFDVLSLPADRADGRLNSLLLLVLAAIVLGTLVGVTELSWAIVVGVILLLGFGDFTSQLARLKTADDAVAAAAFCVGGGLAAVSGMGATHAIDGADVADILPMVVFLAASGALFAAILRDQLPRYDDPLVLVLTGGLCWLLSLLEPVVTGTELAIALIVMVVLGYASYRLETASVAGMLAGILLGLLTIVLGGWGWFAVLISFFAIGGLSTKYRYAEKERRGVAEGNNGARGSANVFSNSAVALVAVVGYAASNVSVIGVDPLIFQFAFAGAVATALGDTLSSEIGGVYENPRLITTFEVVPPGTDGGVTWQGELAGIAGASTVAVIAAALFEPVTVVGFAVVLLSGIVGMTVDSLLGATLEGGRLGNQGVNFCATFTGALVGALAVGPLGLV
ncbi:DUF92 domain-containing protein [Halovivax gelatinilyticus]|uniref:DUF92 domain-containing protein n=1 Tax=Halovivax gelatinilyticus TaxID=2961597 RepID=UPI0020CA6FE9|nr:DUF92 domain-containing protein [Halovivax gelatinilyticus]